MESHSQNGWDDVADVNTYRAGTTTVLDWFAPAVHPSFSDAFAVRNSRWQDFITLNVQAWTPSGGHAIAGSLTLSARTVQRRIRYLTDLAGVDTRVQLGWHAARKDWA